MTECKDTLIAGYHTKNAQGCENETSWGRREPDLDDNQMITCKGTTEEIFLLVLTEKPQQIEHRT